MITSKFLFWWCICNVIINTFINAKFVQLKECTLSSSKLKQHNNFATKTLVSRHTVVCRAAKKADRPHFEYICDRISHNKASTHTKSNLRFYQKWIAGLIHYHIPHCTSFRTGKSGFCGSFLPTLSKPRVGDWRH